MAEHDENGQENNECFPLLRPNATQPTPPGPATQVDPAGDNNTVDPPEIEESDPPPEDSSPGLFRTAFRPTLQSSNFITEDKALTSPVTAIARHKYMIFSSHYLKSYKTSTILDTTFADRRFPEYVYRLQDELAQYYDQSSTTGASLLEDQSVPSKVRQDFPEYFNDIDPLL